MTITVEPNRVPFTYAFREPVAIPEIPGEYDADASRWRGVGTKEWDAVFMGTMSTDETSGGSNSSDSDSDGDE